MLPKTVSPIPLYLRLSVLLTVILAAIAIVGRFQVEERNRSVSISAEYETIESLAGSQGITIGEALTSLKRQGLRSVVLSEDTAGVLLSEGRLAVTYEALSQTKAMPGTNPMALDLTARNPGDVARVIRGVSVRYGGSAAPILLTGGAYRFVRLTPASLRALPIGIDPEAATNVKNAGLQIIARMGNPVGLSFQGVKDTIAWSHDLGATIFLPQGDQVLGRRKALPSLILALRQNQMLYASPEFAKLGGDENVLEAAPDICVRLHAAQAAELDKLTLPAAVDRYAKAARERNMRILLLRPVSYAEDKPLYVFGDFVKLVSKAIIKEGAALGPPRPFTPPITPNFIFMLLGLSLAPPVFFLMRMLYRPMAPPAVTLTVLLGLASYQLPYREYAALIAAIIFPILAFVWLDKEPRLNHLAAYGGVTFISLIGGLVVAGILSGLPYYIHALVFPGVKLAVFLPIVVVGIYFSFRLTDSAATWKSPITWGTAAFSFLIVGALAFMLARTGNDSPAAVSGSELKFRDILDVLLFVRPRTKSFLIGFPFLFIGTGMLLRYKAERTQLSAGYGGWTALALMLGAIGMTDIVNTLCHLHTPVLLSLERNLVGFVLGSVIGYVAWRIIDRQLGFGRLSPGGPKPTDGAPMPSGPFTPKPRVASGEFPAEEGN